MNTPVTTTVETTRSTTVNYATENAVLLCSMNIAKNHWVRLKCSVIEISLHLLWHFEVSLGYYIYMPVSH